jgi:uncharacterized membrane protein
MIWAALYAYFHLLAAGLAAGLLLVEYWWLAGPIDRRLARFLGLADLAYLLALIAAAATGIARISFGRGADAYLGNHLFLLKLLLLAVVMVVAMLPTRQYVAWVREARSARSFAPLSRDLERVRAAVALELGLLALAPLPAVLVSYGFGF